MKQSQGSKQQLERMEQNRFGSKFFGMVKTKRKCDSQMIDLQTQKSKNGVLKCPIETASRLDCVSSYVRRSYSIFSILKNG